MPHQPLPAGHPAPNPAPNPAPPPSLRLASHPEMGPLRLSAFGLTLGLVTGLDFSSTLMMAVASQHIQGGVNATPSDYLYAVSAYAAAAVLMNMLLDQIARRITYKRFTMASLVVFVLGAILCAEAGSPTGLIVGKTVEGLGAGGLFAASRILVQLLTAPAERAPLLLRFGLGSFGLLAVTPWLTGIVWATARKLGHSQFMDEETAVEDDHIPFVKAGVPSLDIIDLDYPQWHTPQDTIDAIAARSIQIVGDVVVAALPQIEARLIKN